MRLTLVAEQSDGKVTSLAPPPATSPKSFLVAKLASMMFSIACSYKHPSSYIHHVCCKGHLHFYLPCTRLCFFSRNHHCYSLSFSLVGLPGAAVFCCGPTLLGTTYWPIVIM